MRAVDRAIEVALFAPLHIIGDYQIEFAVAIVINPGSAGRKFIRTPHPGRLGHLGKGSVSVVVKEMALAECGNEDIIEAIVVVVTYRNSKSENRNSKPGAASHIGERAVVIIVIKLGRRRAGVRMSGEVCPVDQQDVRVTIIVVVNEGAAWTHGFGEPLLTERTVVVREVNAGLGGDVLETEFGREHFQAGKP